MSEANAIIRGDIRHRLRFGPLLRSIFRHLHMQALVRRDIAYLRHQPDRMLQDIGLNRADLPDGHEFNPNSHQRLWMRHR